tara:strand:- start:186 stop:833 length:648 start_codon:yes stop_codon:yes gene_type:complete
MLKYQVHQSGNTPPKNAVILLHGYGANGADLIELGKVFSETNPETVFIAPDAPTPCEMGGPGFQWFSLREYTPASLKAGSQQAFPVLKELITHIKSEYDLKDKSIALMGFSQGTMMSLYAMLQMPETIATVIGYSGALAEDTVEARPAYDDFPVALVHGDADLVVPVQATVMATHILEKAGFDVTQEIITNLGHGIDNSGLEIGKKMLKMHLKLE